MTDDRYAELLGAYALHALDPEEQRDLEAHLAACPRCRSEAQALEQTAALLGSTGGDASAEIWEAISQELDGAPLPLPRALRSPSRGVRRRPAAILLAAAAALVAIGVLGVQTVRQDRRIDDLQTALADARAGDRGGDLAAALSTPGARQVQLTSADGAALVPAVVLPDGSAYLVGASLPRLAGTRTYQVWGQGRGDEGMVSLGVVGGAPEVEPFHVEPGTQVLAITAERQPGAAQPTSSPIVVGELQ
jgi:anti-sigma factor RsiW